MAYEGAKAMAAADLTGGAAWTETRQTVVIPGNIRKVALQLAFEGESALGLDDVFVKTAVDQPFDADGVLREKPLTDAHTLCLVDFDGQGSYRAEAGAEVTNAGRFGKGLRLDAAKVSSVVVPLNLKRMPAEGTLEFWLSPDDDAAHIYEFMTLLAGGQDVLRLTAGTDASLRTSWRVSAGQYDRQNSIGGSYRDQPDWFRKGQWQHIAIQWCDEALRYYVNGVLIDYSTESPLPFFATPSALLFGPRYSHTAWSGCLDEIRLSDIQRYGPGGSRGREVETPGGRRARAGPGVRREDAAPTARLRPGRARRCWGFCRNRPRAGWRSEPTGCGRSCRTRRISRSRRRDSYPGCPRPASAIRTCRSTTRTTMAAIGR